MDDKAAATKVVTAHLPRELADRVDAYAARMERSRGWIVKQALADWIWREEEKDRLTREAMAEVDAGFVIPHEEVEAWALSLETDTPLPRPRPRLRR
jgi:predicted transcriptional regulator